MSKTLVTRSVSLAPDMPPLRAVRLENGQVGATLQSLCSGLGLNISGQQKRIARARNLRSASVIVKIATKGGPQEMTVLLAWAIPLWVIGIQTDRLDAIKRARVLIIQTQAVEAIYRAFSNTVSNAVLPTEEAIEVEMISDSSLNLGLEARVAELERIVRDQAKQAKAIERLLASAIQRIYWLQDYIAQRDSQQEQKPPTRRRGRRKRIR